MATNYEDVDLNDEENKILLKIPNPSFIWYDGSNRQIFVARKFLTIDTDILNLDVRTDDVWVTSYPKAGTTWTQEMVWCIMNDLNFELAKSIQLQKRFPFIESDMLTIDPNDNQKTILESVKNLKSPRFIKSHLPWTLLPKQIQNGSVKPKMIYVTRNPKDVCMSYYNHYQLLRNFQGSLDEFCELFINNKVFHGSFFYNVESYLKNKHLPNLLIIKYEDMKKNLAAVIRKVAKFLDKTLTDQQINQLLDHLSFESMKKNPSVNYEETINSRQTVLRRPGDRENSGSFINVGQVGYAKKILPEKYMKILDERCELFEMRTQYKFESQYE